jgi:hypothetical protein
MKLIMWRWCNVKLMKCEVDEMWCWWNVKLMKCEVDQIWSWWNVKLMKFEVDETWSWSNLKLMKCKVDEMWRWNLKLMKSEVESILSWCNEKMKCADGEMWRWWFYTSNINFFTFWNESLRIVSSVLVSYNCPGIFVGRARTFHCDWSNYRWPHRVGAAADPIKLFGVYLLKLLHQLNHFNLQLIIFHSYETF